MEKITIIVPVYNEQESLFKFKEKMDDFLLKSKFETSVLFVNDGSNDDSLLIIKSIARTDQRYHFISLSNNSGLSTAIKAGIDYVNTPWLGYIDADLQTLPTDFLLYFDYMPSHEMINGIRAKRKDTFVKKISSKVANRFRRWMINDGIADTCCPLKIIKTDFAKSIPFFKGMHRFMPALIQLQGGKVKEVEIRHFERYAGMAKYNLRNRLIGPFIDTLAFVWIKRRYINYTILDEKIIPLHKKELIES
jgi:dolichol-phosphate mannosyltransferase